MTTIVHADLEPGTRVVYSGSLAAYVGQEVTVVGSCGRFSCCRPVVVPGVVYRVDRLILRAEDGTVVRHVHPKSVSVISVPSEVRADEPAMCGPCKGDGFVPDTRCAAITHQSTTVRRKCPHCEGFGWVDPEPKTD